MPYATETRLRDRYPPAARPGPARPPGRPAPAPDLAPLTGLWHSYDRETTGILRLEITARGPVPVVRVHGAGVPGPIDWGEVPAQAFTAGVAVHESVGFSARYQLDFARILLAAYLNKRLLVVDAYTVFTDGSGRNGYFQRDHLHNLGPGGGTP
jgi:hypothetical protein